MSQSRSDSRASTSHVPSSLSSFATATPHSKLANQEAARRAGLSAKQIGKYSDTIASVRRATAQTQSQEVVSEESDLDFSVSRSKGKNRAIPLGAFAERSSFASAPLVSRLVAASPHRKHASAQSARTAALSNLTNGLVEGKGALVSHFGVEDRTGHTSRGTEDQNALPDDLRLQEALIIEDLLHVLTGTEGRFIEFAPFYHPEDIQSRLRGAHFVVHHSLDHSLRNLVERILPLAAHFISVSSYVDLHGQLELGLVNHALSANLRDLQDGHLNLIACLEYQFCFSATFRLQQLWVCVQPMLHNFALVHRLLLELVELPDQVEDYSDDSAAEDDPSLEESLPTPPERRKMVSLRGGEVLAVLESRLELERGDPRARDLLSRLFLCASKPYVKMLMSWVTMGILHDPFDEFFIRENTLLKQCTMDSDYVDDYWEHRYVLKDATLGTKIVTLEEARDRGLTGSAIVPKCLAGLRLKILLAGKYLNVIREYGLDVRVAESDLIQGIEMDMRKPSFLKSIEIAFGIANAQLLQMLVKDQDLVERLRSLKHCFFLDCGDAFTSFLDHAKGDLGRSSRLASLSKLQNLLDVALRNPSSSSSSDPYKEDVRVGLAKESLTDSLVQINSVQGLSDLESLMGSGISRDNTTNGPMTGYDAFVLDYAVRFPLTLVFSRKVIHYYQLIFRFLFQLRHAELQLTQIWLEHAKSPIWHAARAGSSRHPGLEGWKARANLLCQHMLAFVQHMYSYAVEEVLEPRWRAYVRRIDDIETVDQLLQEHLDFLNTCLKELMMTSNDLLRLFSKMLGTCHMLYSYNGQFAKSTAAAVVKLKEVGGDHSRVDISQQNLTLAKFEKHFYYHQNSLIKLVTYYASETTSFLPLAARLESLRSREPK